MIRLVLIDIIECLVFLTKKDILKGDLYIMKKGLFVYCLICTLVITGLSSCGKDVIVDDDKYNFSFVLYDFNSWIQVNYETIKNERQNETFDSRYRNMEILTQRFFDNKKKGDKLRYCVVKLSDKQKQATIEDMFYSSLEKALERNARDKYLFPGYEHAEFVTINGRRWYIHTTEISNSKEVFVMGTFTNAVISGVRAYMVTKTDEHLISFIYDFYDMNKSKELGKFMKEITIN